MIPADLNNPFVAHSLDHTLSLPAGHVKELHKDTLTKCMQVLARSRQSGHSTGLLILGEAGSGKSHLIAHIRHELVTDPGAVLVAIRLRGSYAGKLWRHTRHQLVEELLWQYPDPAQGGNGLLRLLRRRFPTWAKATQKELGGLMGWLVGGSSSGTNLAPHLEEFDQGGKLNHKLKKVLPNLANPALRNYAHSWLKGDQLGEEDLRRLGLPGVLPSEQEQEIEAQDLVLSFLRLAGDQTALFLCFDEVEAVQAGNYDAIVLREFATLLTGLLAEAGPRVVATSIRPILMQSLLKSVEVSNLQKMCQDETQVHTLTWEQAVRIVVARLEADLGCQQARRQSPNEPFWPFSREFLETLFQKNRRNLTPRHLIMACRSEFDRLQSGRGPGPEVTDPFPGSNTTALEESFKRLWDQLRKKHLQKLQGLPFDTVMALGLPWLVDLMEPPPFVRVEDQDKRLGDVNLVFHPTRKGAKGVGISLCNQEPRSVWRRLGRLLDQWKAAKKDRLLKSLVVLRSSAERTTETAQAKLEALRKAGVRVILVERQELAEMAAFQRMLTDAQNGDLTWRGQPINPDDFHAWAKANLSEAVKEFFDRVLEPDDTGSPPAKRPQSTPAVK